MLETLWKVVKDVTDNLLKACIPFHDVLHRLREGRGMWMAILELKVSQDLTSINQYPLFLMFLELCKAYDTLEWGHLLKTLEVYGSGNHMYEVLEELWEWKEVVTRKNEYHGFHFQVKRGTTQGVLISPSLFNLAFENVVRNWLSMTEEGKIVDHDRL